VAVGAAIGTGETSSGLVCADLAIVIVIVKLSPGLNGAAAASGGVMGSNLAQMRGVVRWGGSAAARCNDPTVAGDDQHDPQDDLECEYQCEPRA
jgi:hypothetical protein